MASNELQIGDHVSFIGNAGEPLEGIIRGFVQQGQWPIMIDVIFNNRRKTYFRKQTEVQLLQSSKKGE